MQNERLPDNSSDEINIQDIWVLIIDHWKLFLISVVATLFFGAFYIWYSHPVYVMKATVVVGDENSDLSQSILDEVGVLGKKKNVENEIAIVSSRFLMHKAISELRMNVNCIVKLGLRSREIYTNRPIDLDLQLIEDLGINEFKLGIDFTDNTKMLATLEWEDKDRTERLEEHEIELANSFSTGIGNMKVLSTETFDKYVAGDSAYSKSYIFHYMSDELLTSHYMDLLKVSAARDKASILELTIKDRLRLRGEGVINKLLKVYISNSVEKKNLLASNALTFIDDQLEHISGDLGSLESDIQDYKIINQISNVGSEAAFFLEQVGVVDTRISEVNVKISFMDYLSSYVRANQDLKNAAPTSIGIQDPLLVELLTEINRLTSERESLLQFTRQDNPLVQSLDVKIRTAKDALVNNVESIKSGLFATKEQLDKQQEKLESRVKLLPKAEYDLLALERKYAIKEGLYLLLLGKKSENAIVLASTVSDNFVLDEARGSDEPIAPKRAVIIIFALLIGLGLPLLFVVVKSMFSTTIRNKQVLKRATNIPFLGIVPHNTSGEKLVVSTSSHSPIAESFRSLRTSVGFLTGKDIKNAEGSTVLQFTSSSGSEGKSFCSINLAASLALSGAPTIILGLDLRKPKLAEYLSVSNNIGASTILAGMHEVNDCIIKTNVDNLDLIVAGPIPPNPSELLLWPSLKQMIDTLSETYRYIILDTPPLGLVSDSLVIAKHVDATIYLVRQNITQSNDLDYINDIYNSGQISGVSILFNDVSLRGNGYGYGYYEAAAEQTSWWKRPFT